MSYFFIGDFVNWFIDMCCGVVCFVECFVFFCVDVFFFVNFDFDFVYVGSTMRRVVAMFVSSDEKFDCFIFFYG